MKKQYVILMVLFFFISTSCGKYKVSHDTIKSRMEFLLGRIEFEATLLKLEAYKDEYDKAFKGICNRPFYAGVDPLSAEALICDECEKEIPELTQTAKKQFLFLCKVASREYQFEWLFNNKTDKMNEAIAPGELIAEALVNNKYFSETNSVWADFIHESWAKKRWWKNLF